MILPMGKAAEGGTECPLIIFEGKYSQKLYQLYSYILWTILQYMQTIGVFIKISNGLLLFYLIADTTRY